MLTKVLLRRASGSHIDFQPVASQSPQTSQARISTSVDFYLIFFYNFYTNVTYKSSHKNHSTMFSFNIRTLDLHSSTLTSLSKQGTRTVSCSHCYDGITESKDIWMRSWPKVYSCWSHLHQKCAGEDSQWSKS